MSVVTATTEEYLETIYRLQKKRGVARTSDIVNALKVVPGTVTNTVERLEREGYITHTPYRGVTLTEKGHKIAIQVIRKHRLSERLLTDLLHLEWDKVHNVACKLEHSIIDEIIKPLEKALNHPKTCPHGNPIPTKCGAIIEEKSKRLIELKEEDRGIIIKITEEEPKLLSHLKMLGLIPGVKIEVLKKSPSNGSITLKVGNNRRVIDHETSSVIYIKQTKGERERSHGKKKNERN